jgi:hypothetical protein
MNWLGSGAMHVVYEAITDISSALTHFASA